MLESLLTRRLRGVFVTFLTAYFAICVLWIFMSIAILSLKGEPAPLGESKCIPEQMDVQGLDDLTTTVYGTSVDLVLQRPEGTPALTGKLGVALPPELGQPLYCATNPADEICWEWGTEAKLEIVRSADSECYTVTWQSHSLNKNKDCFDIPSASFWFGAQEEYRQHFPLETGNGREEAAYLPGDMLQDHDRYFGGVIEPWWVNSNGIGLWVPYSVPLWWSWNAPSTPDQMCFAAKYEHPYVKSDNEDMLRLQYDICLKPDAKQMQEYGISTYLGKPSGIPDERTLRLPIWSTWAQYKMNINASIVLDFATQIAENGFKNGQLEIDDNWEVCYGDAAFDENKFPDPAAMVTQLNTMGFRTTLWIHPFVNMECSSWAANAMLPNAHFLQDVKGLAPGDHLPGLTYWWQSDLASYVDFTRQTAVNWWAGRLSDLLANTGIDSFKFDAGEANWMPQSYQLNADKSLWPSAFTTAYVAAVAQFGGMVEVRVGRDSHEHPIFVRMLDKDSKWGYDNGLKTMLTTLLQTSFAGYPFVLPDMIGGNGYGSIPGTGGNAPERELYIRWLQANVFMPAMQFSYVPWIYDQEVTDYSLAMTELHESYGDTIVALANNAVATGEAINRPIWWLDPTDEIALSIDSEFLLGDDLLVAPVLEEGATSRDVYLPTGTWRDEASATHEEYTGPMWIQNYSADLWTLPYFTRVSAENK